MQEKIQSFILSFMIQVFTLAPTMMGKLVFEEHSAPVVA